ncbi:MAG TPA: CotH kinase family protein, partial [Candidatus Binatia bacterium]|nr:CotH kinase family protein [Candidatus Binatia bacterium]
DLGLGWAAPGFDDSSWLATTNRIGFDPDKIDAPLPTLDLRSRMLGRNSSAYLRVPFQVSDPGFETIKLRLRYNDGFIAYLNGHEVARRNAPEKPQWNSNATAAHGSGAPVVLEERFDAATGSYTLAQLDAITRPKLTQHAQGTPGGFLRLINGHQTNQVNSISFSQTATGLCESVVADFDFRWRGTGDGTERLVFLLIPTAVYAASGPGVDLAAFRDVKDPKFPGVFAVQLLHSLETGQNALTIHWDRSKRTTANLPTEALGPRVFHHAQVQLKHTDQGAVITVTLTADANGAGKQNYVPVSGLLIPGLRPYPARVQFAGRIGHWDQTIDLDNLHVEFVPIGEQAAEEFDLSRQINLLRAGKNVLAIHALNQKADDPSFLVQPELIAGYSALRSDERRYFSTPTPRSINREGLRGLSPPPVFSKRGGVFLNPVKLELSAGSGAVRYTLDGSEPTASSQPYTEPILLSSSTLVKARTFAPDLLPSGTVTETFTLLDASLANFNSNLPLLILNPFGQYLSANSKSMISVRFIDTANGRSSLLGTPDLDGRASVNLHGFSTLRQPKNSLTLRIKDENDDKVKVPLLGFPRESDWVLYAPFSDKTLMRDVLAYELSNKMGRYAPRTRFVEVFIDRSGGKLSQRDYMGVYVLVEKIIRGKNRVNITELFGSDNTEPNITGGYIFKRDHSERYEPSFRTSRGVHFYFVEPKAEELSREQISWLGRYMNRFEQALYGPDFRDPARGYANYLDVDAFIDQHWLVEMSKNIDGFRYSAFLHKDRGGKLQMGPAWDWNLSFGNADYHDGSNPEGWYTSLLRENELCWFRRLSEDPDFEQRAIDRWGALRRTVFAPSNLLARVDELAAYLNESQARNFRRWPILGRRINPNDFVGSTY